MGTMYNAEVCSLFSGIKIKRKKRIEVVYTTEGNITNVSKKFKE